MRKIGTFARTPGGEKRLTLRNHPFKLRTRVVVSSTTTELSLDIIHTNWQSFEDWCRDGNGADSAGRDAPISTTCSISPGRLRSPSMSPTDSVEADSHRTSSVKICACKMKTTFKSFCNLTPTFQRP